MILAPPWRWSPPSPRRPTATPQEPSPAEAGPERPADATPRPQPITSWSFGANEGALLDVRSGDAPALAILIDAVSVRTMRSPRQRDFEALNARRAPEHDRHCERASAPEDGEGRGAQ